MAETIQKLAIVGASARAAASSARRAGFDVTAADLFADADLQRLEPVARIADYPAGLAAWLRDADCDAWMYTGALENRPELVSQLAALRLLAGNCGEPLVRSRDPLALQTELAEAGLAFPETRRSAEDLPRDGSWLCKTYRGASGSGVWRLDGPDAATRALRDRAVYQRFVAGASASAVFVCTSGGAGLLGMTRQLVGDASVGAKAWQYSGSVAPLAVATEVGAQLSRLGELLESRLGLRGLVGVDLVIESGRAWVVEINPRYSASVEVIELATGVSAVAAHLAACAGSLPAAPPAPAGERVFGKVVLYAKRAAVVSGEFFDWAIEHIEADARRLADLPHAGATIAAGQPVLTVLVAAPAPDYDAELREFLGTVEARLYGSS